MTFYTKSGLFKFFVSALFIFFLIPPFFYYAPRAGLDSSWNIALHLAYKYHLQFGSDFAFTYGPLGILNSRLPVSMNIWVYLLFDLYFFIITAIVLREVFRKNFTVAVCVFIFLNILIGEYAPVYDWYFYYFFFFLLGFLKDQGRRAWLLQAMLLSVLSFYFKVSYGIITVIVFAVAVVFLFLRRKIILKWFVAIVLLYLAGIWIGALLLHVRLFGYIKASLSFIDGYNDAMFREMDALSRPYLRVALVIIAIFAVAVVFLGVKSVRRKHLGKSLDELLTYLLVAMGFYIIFKSSFVRSDAGGLFFQYSGLFMGLIYLNADDALVRRVSIICSWTILAISTVATNRIPGHYHPYERVADLSLFGGKMKEVKNYLTQITEFRLQVTASEQVGSGRNEYKDIIGERTTDIIPSEISTIFFNGLHYAPAPVIQQYAAYNTYLDGLNYAKYNSATAPDFILYSVGSIDDRYAFFDGARAKIALMNHYRVTGSIHDDLLLKRFPASSGLETTLVFDTSHYNMNEEISLPRTNDILYSKIFVHYNLIGSLRRLLFQPPVLKMIITLDDNTERTFRAIVPMLADGMILNKYIDSQEEFQEYMQSAGTHGTDISSIRLQSEEAGFKPQITMVSTYYRFSQKSATDRLSDSLAIVALRRRYVPQVVSLTDYKKDTIKDNVEVVNTYSDILSFKGWAFRDTADNRRCRLTGMLTKGGDSAYAMPTLPLPRPDLESAFKRKDLDLAGFRAEADRKKFPPGSYLFALAYVDTLNGRKWIKYTQTGFVLKDSADIENGNVEKADLSGSRKISQDEVVFDVGKLSQNSRSILMEGWVQLKDHDTTGLRTRIILQSRNGTFGVEPEVRERPDVAEHFHDPRYRFSGFKAHIPTEKLPPGIYNISLEKITADGTGYLIETGKQVVVRTISDSSVRRIWVPAP